ADKASSLSSPKQSANVWLTDEALISLTPESGLNKRAVEFRKQLETYSGVKDISASSVSQTLADCFGDESEEALSATPTDLNSLGCRNYSFKSSNNISRVVEGGNIVLNSGKKRDPVTGLLTDEDAVQNNYMAYTLIKKYAPQTIAIPSTEDYGGLNALEYKYVLEATAKKPANSETTPAGNAANSSANVDLSMTFTNRVISLFQFAIFYNGDLEFNSTSPMQVEGWVHSNANIYVQPAGEPSPASKSLTTFLSKVSAVGSIYNRVDAWTPGATPGSPRTGITRLLLTGTSCPGNDVFPLPAPSPSSTNICKDIPDYSASNTDPLTSTQIDTFEKKLQAGISKLKTPPSSFTRKRSYRTDKVEIGEYFAKADMRLDFVPNRGRTETIPFSVIPFNFTAMTTTGSGACSTTAPTGSNDPDANYVDPKREGRSALKCNKLTKGQLQSLRQPVMVLTNINQPDTTLRDTAPTTAVPSPPRGTESTILGRPATLPTAPGLRGLNNTDDNKSKILRALQVALVSTPAPISVDRLGISFNDARYLTPSNPGYDLTLAAFRAEFSRLLDRLFVVPVSGTLTSAQQDNQDDKRDLLNVSPNEIAALRGAWFLPAPIQQVIKTNTNGTTAASPPSGFYDGRERRWISVLQTNIASLAVWNRDGLYVNDSNALTSAYAASETDRNNAFNDATTASYSTNGLAFDRATAANIAAAVPAITAKGLQTLGLGSIDSTEGGLVVHASVNDDLNGNGSIDTTTEITKDTTKPIEETKTVDGVTTTTTIDYFRRYPGVTGTPKSPYAFAFTGGDYLPNNLLLSSDQAIYIQGDFNNNTIRMSDGTKRNRMLDGSQPVIPDLTANDPSDTRQSASIIADTITVLSNDCINPTAPTLGIPAGQLNCGIGETGGGANLVTKPMVINAAFLSNTDVSNGNLGTGRGYDASSTANNKYSGGVNNYIRLLEDWNNAGTPYTLNYMGSMISLGAPLEYSGRFKPGGEASSGSGSTFVPASYYNIPFRSFRYDPNFNSVDKMPPLTPKASYIQQKNFSRKY
ncbi:hypothetical protein, partial [Chamaesiphon sp. OTE_8_metabat_110]|uniref:hypothetical protein n=1 Tax=Chamaesiphon sp. OTE_8_metabat_110 TaxID=2964696 RepID=UPI00286ACA7F